MRLTVNKRYQCTNTIRFWLKVTSLLFLVALYGCSDSKKPTTKPATKPATATTTPGETPPAGGTSYPSVRFTPCPLDVGTSELRCGVLDTYEDYDKTGPDARIIQVAFAIAPAATTPAAADPIVFFNGGPGESSLLNFADIAEFVGSFSNDREIIMVEQRGVGFSSPFLTCEGLLESEDTDVEAAKECVKGFEDQGVDLSQYRSAVSAQDFKALREALDIAQWNVYGVSYGPILGILYANLDVAGVRSLIFDASTDNQVDIALADAATVLDYITELADQCALEADCAGRMPDLDSLFVDTFRSLNDDPWIFEVPGNEDKFEFNGTNLLVIMTDGDSLFAPGILEIFAKRDTESMVRILTQLAMEDDGDSGDAQYEELKKRQSADLMHTTVQCSAIDAVNFDSGIIPTREQWPDDMLSFFRDLVPYPGLCTQGIVSIQPDLSQREPISLDLPTLILGGGLDTAVSIKQVRQLTESFVSPTLGVIPKGGHGVDNPDSFTDPCINKVLTTFVENPQNAPDVACLAEGIEPFIFGEELVENY